MSLDYWSVWNCTGSYLTNILQTPYGLQMTIDSHKTPELASKYHLPYTVEVFRFVVRAESDDVFYAEQKFRIARRLRGECPKGFKVLTTVIDLYQCHLWVYHNGQRVHRLQYQTHEEAVDAFNHLVDYLCEGFVFLRYHGWIVEPSWTDLSDIAHMLDKGLIISMSEPYPIWVYCEKDTRDSHIVVKAQDVRALCVHLLNRDDWLRILSVLRDAGVEVDGEYEPQWLLDMQKYADKHAQE